MIDNQSAIITRKFFSQEVQDKMVEIEELKEYVESQKEPKDRQIKVKTSPLSSTYRNGMRLVIPGD